MSEADSHPSRQIRMPAVAALVTLCTLDAAAEPPADVIAIEQPPPQVVAVSSRRERDAAPDYQRHYEEALAQGQYREAEMAAKQIIDGLIDDDRAGHMTRAQALSRLAFAQRQRQLYESALQNYEAAIQLLEMGENRLSASLVAPLHALGDTYMESGQADLAMAVYDQALHIRHVNDGPHTLDQVELLDAMATALVERGDVDGALAAVDRVYYLYARAFAPDGEEVLPALERKAALLNDADRHQQERMVYREIVRIIRNRRGESHLSLLEPYTALGRTYFYDLDKVYFRSEPTTETGETFLKKALELTEENPEATWLMQEQALIELGDYYTVRDIQDKARIHYRRAWNVLSSDNARRAQRQTDLERAVLLVHSPLDPYANFGYRSSNENADAADYKQGYVVARFTVNDRGRVTDVGIADADPAGFDSMEVRVMQAVRDFIYRPRYQRGTPVRTSSQRFRHDYLYLESDLAADRK